VEKRVSVGNEHTDRERSEYVEEHNAEEHSLYSSGDVSARVGCFSRCDSDSLNTTIRESSSDEGGEQSSEASSRASGVDFCHSTRMVPVTKANGTSRTSADIDEEGEDDETHDGDDLEGGKAELGFTVYRYGEDVEAKDDDDDYGDPDCGRAFFRSVFVQHFAR